MRLVNLYRFQSKGYPTLLVLDLEEGEGAIGGGFPSLVKS